MPTFSSLRNKTLLAVELTLICCAAQAADFENIVGTRKLIDMNNIEIQADGLRRVWQKYTLNTEIIDKLEANLRLNGKVVNYSKYSHTIASWEYDCKGKQFRVIAGADYSSDGEVINSFQLKGAVMQLAIPDSDGEVTLTAVCAMKPKKRKQ